MQHMWVKLYAAMYTSFREINNAHKSYTTAHTLTNMQMERYTQATSEQITTTTYK